MRFKVYYPKYPLNNFIESIMCYENYSSDKTEAILPEGNSILVISLDEQKRVFYDPVNKKRENRRQWFIGYHTIPIVYNPETNASLLAVKFSYNGFYKLFKIPMMELSNQIVNLDDIADNELSNLRERLLAHNTIEKKIKEVVLFFEKKILVSDNSNSWVNEFLIPQLIENNSLNQLVDSIGYSKRYIIEIFKAHTGSTPKQFQNLMRFNKAIHALSNNQNNFNLTDIAYKCNYFDQAHFIREFRKFGFKKPSEYVRMDKRAHHILEIDSIGNFCPIL